MGDRYMMIVYLSILTALLFSEVSCDVGTNCTAPDVTTCGGDPAGTEYQCDVNGLCQCTDGYYESSGICTAKPGYKEECDDPTKPCKNEVGLICTDVAGTNRCTCDTTTHYDNTTQCLMKPKYSETCNSTTGCLGNLTCLSIVPNTNGNCGCDDTQYYHDGKNNCLKKPGFNVTCTSSIGCLGNLNCLADSNLCGCDDTQYHKDNKCLQKSAINRTCNSVDGCLGNLTCSSTDPDTNGNCGCDSTQYYHDSNYCLPKSRFNGTCTSVEGCLGNLTCSDLSNNGNCGCDNTQYYHDGNNTCLEKSEFNGTCTSDTECLGNLTCSTDSTKCGCDDTQYYHDGNNCLQKKEHGESCTTVGSCNLDFGDCVESTCSCSDNYYTDNKMCRPVAELKPTVTRGDTTSSSVTITWTVLTKDAIQSFNVKGNGPNIEKTGIDKNSRTVTITGLTPNTEYTNVRVETVVTTDRNPALVVPSDQQLTFTTSKAGYSDTCVLPTSTDQCSVTNTECFDLEGRPGGPKCYCKIGFYTNNNECFNATELKTNPTGVTPETDTAIVTWTLNSPSNSQFITSFSIDVNGTSNKDNIANSATSGEITGLLAGTVYSVKVISIVKTDRNQNYKVESQSLPFTTKQASGSNCNPNDTKPCAGNLTCINNICGCPTEDYVYNNYCYPKLGYNGDCSSTSQACQTDLDCYKETGSSLCKCKSGEYKSDTECKPVNELKPSGISVTASTASSFTFAWNVLSETYINEFVISGNSFQNQIFSKTLRTGTVTGLSPGTDYTNINITAKVKTDRGSIIDDAVSNQTLSDSTNPGKPGSLNSNNDYDTTRVMNIRFGQPAGGVEKYIAEITGPGLTDPFKQEPATNIITVPAITLQPGKIYSISIIAVYNGKNSLEFTGSFRTNSQGSSPVKDLTITNISSRNITVSWSYPDEDSGELSAYILDVNIGSECIQQFIYVTDINNNLTLNNCVTPTYIPTVLRPNVTQLVTDLLPYINYTLIVTPYNDAGLGSTNSELATTAIEAAGEPSNLNVPESDIKATSFNVTWTKPTNKTGPTTYYLNVYEQKDLTHNQAMQFVTTYSVKGYDREDYLIVKDIVSYWYYRVELQASTSVGNSSIINSTEFQTLSSAPGIVESFVVSPKNGIYTTADVSWSCIKEKNRHGIIQNYTLTSTLENEGPKTIQQGEGCQFSDTVRVKPGQQITFVLFAYNMDFKGEEKQINYKAPTGKPMIAKEEDIILVSKTEEIGQTSFSVTVCPRCLTDETNGPIEITALLVCVKDKCDIKNNQLMLEDVKKFSTWKTAQANSFESPYRVTNDTWYGDKVVDEVKFVVGTDTASNCDKQAEGYFCNGPLNMDTEYQIIAVSCTVGGCSVSRPIGSFRTEAPPDETDIVTPVVVSIVVILVVVAVILAAVYFYKRRKNQEQVDEQSIHSIDSIPSKSTVPRYRPIKIEHFEEQIASLQKDSNLLFSEEFEGIGELSPRHESIAAQMEENKPKNRYVNILAFDHSRVKLLPIDDDETTDYINANYIPGYKSQREYIATQGPLVTNVGGVDISTIPDFWRMIWEQRVAIIVMLSDLTEKGKPKVDKYWKDQGESEQYGDIIVEVTSVSVLNKYTIKIFELTLGEEVRKVRHFFLPGWEDYRANLQPEDVLEFLSVVRQEVKPIDKGPMVVHCSAGVGRTGTFIALDIFQQYINERDMSSDIDIYDLVLRMRNFRQNMVQSEKQYIFIHETIKEIISQRKKRLQDNDAAIYENTGYSNEAFVPDDIYQNVENGKPTTTL